MAPRIFAACMTRKASIVLLLITLAFMGRIVVTSFVPEVSVYSMMASTDMEKESLEEDGSEDDKLSEGPVRGLLSQCLTLRHVAIWIPSYRDLIREIQSPPPQA